LNGATEEHLVRSKHEPTDDCNGKLILLLCQSIHGRYRATNTIRRP
jgi:hypothetical protein